MLGTQIPHLLYIEVPQQLQVLKQRKSQWKWRAKIAHSKNKGQIDWISIVTTANNIFEGWKRGLQPGMAI